MENIRNKAMNALIKLEEKHSVYDVDINGFPIWLNIRERVHELLMARLNNSDYQPVISKGKNYRYFPLRVILGFTNYIKYLTGCNADLFISNSSFCNRDGNRFFPEEIANDGYVVELPCFTDSDNIKLRSKSTIYFDFLLPFIYLHMRLSGGKIINEKNVINLINDDLFTWSDKKFLIELFYYECRLFNSASKITKFFFRRKINRLFDVARASRLLFLCDYKEHIEMQHGVIHNTHPGYMFGCQNRVRKHFENWTILLNDESTYDTLCQEYSWSRVKKCVIGNWTLDSVEKNRNESKKSILITTQWDPTLQKKYVNLVDKLVTSSKFKEWDLVVKPHPKEFNAEDLYCSRDERVKIYKGDLSSAFSENHVHLTISSTTAIDAIPYDVINAVLKNEYQNSQIKKMVESNIIHEISNVDEILDLGSNAEINYKYGIEAIESLRAFIKKY